MYTWTLKCPSQTYSQFHLILLRHHIHEETLAQYMYDVRVYPTYCVRVCFVLSNTCNIYNISRWWGKKIDCCSASCCMCNETRDVLQQQKCTASFLLLLIKFVRIIILKHWLFSFFCVRVGVEIRWEEEKDELVFHCIPLIYELEPVKYEKEDYSSLWICKKSLDVLHFIRLPIKKKKKTKAISKNAIKM